MVYGRGRLGYITHRDHYPGVDPVPRVPVRLTRNGVVRPEVAFPLHGLAIACEGLVREGRGSHD